MEDEVSLDVSEFNHAVRAPSRTGKRVSLILPTNGLLDIPAQKSENELPSLKFGPSWSLSEYSSTTGADYSVRTTIDDRSSRSTGTRSISRDKTEDLLEDDRASPILRGRQASLSCTNIEDMRQSESPSSDSSKMRCISSDYDRVS